MDQLDLFIAQWLAKSVINVTQGEIRESDSMMIWSQVLLSYSLVDLKGVFNAFNGLGEELEIVNDADVVIGYSDFVKLEWSESSIAENVTLENVTICNVRKVVGSNP